MIRIRTEQFVELEQALSADPVDLVEAYLRKHYPDDCAQYSREVLRAWIASNLAETELRGAGSSDEILFDMGTRWVLRAWYGDPPAEPARP